MSEGWIKLHRNLTNWEWYKTPNMVHFWVHCLIRANHDDGKYQGICVPKGSFISGRLSLSAETGLSERSIRTCIERLKTTNELTSKSSSKYTVFTINSWEIYQTLKQNDQQNDQQATSKRPANDQQTTTNKNEKNKKKEKNNTIPEFPSYEIALKFAEEKSLFLVDVLSWFESREIADWVKANGEKVKNWKLDLMNANKFNSFSKKKTEPVKQTFDIFRPKPMDFDHD